MELKILFFPPLQVVKLVSVNHNKFLLELTLILASTVLREKECLFNKLRGHNHRLLRLKRKLEGKKWN